MIAIPAPDQAVLARRAEIVSALRRIVTGEGVIDSENELLGSPGEATLDGVLACNMAGSRRVRAGSARDYFLGFAAINGRGEAWKAGGKVVKNVTGRSSVAVFDPVPPALDALSKRIIEWLRPLRHP